MRILNTVKRKLSITHYADLKMMTTEPNATPQILEKYPYFSPGTVFFLKITKLPPKGLQYIGYILIRNFVQILNYGLRITEFSVFMDQNIRVNESTGQGE
jgi:hypothetical protein